MKVLAIGGATASGKTALAVECAKRLNGEIISCDALLVYRGLDIGTAKPTKEEMAGIPHHMIDVASPMQNYSVSDFERAALPILEDILARNKTPILCGGTGFYMDALLYARTMGGVPAQPKLREELERVAREEGREKLHAMLMERDEESARVLHPNDVKRVIRALEIYEVTGKRKSEQKDSPVPRYPFELFVINYPREELYRRIALRVEEMLCAGLVQEVEGLLARGVSESAQCMQGIGYKEVVECLKNGEEESTMRDIIAKNTRNYAKRQLTFFKRHENLHAIMPQELKAAAQEVIDIYGC